MSIDLSPDDLDRLLSALDSHVYWQLSDPHYHNDAVLTLPAMTFTHLTQSSFSGRGGNHQGLPSKHLTTESTENAEDPSLSKKKKIVIEPGSDDPEQASEIQHVASSPAGSNPQGIDEASSDCCRKLSEQVTWQ